MFSTGLARAARVCLVVFHRVCGIGMSLAFVDFEFALLIGRQSVKWLSAAGGGAAIHVDAGVVELLLTSAAQWTCRANFDFRAVKKCI